MKKKKHTHTFIVTPILSILYYPLFPWNKKKTSKMMNSLVTCLNCPPSVWLSASFTPAIFSHFANLPTRWDDGMLLKVLWLQMSRPDVPLFLQWPCDFIFYQFPALFTFSTPPPHTHTQAKYTHKTMACWTLYTYACKWISKHPLGLALYLGFIKTYPH